MNVLGGVIKDEEIIGISDLNENLEGSLFYLEFFVIIKGGQVKFKSLAIQDVHIATKMEQAYLQNFRVEYSIIRENVFALLGYYSAEFQFHTIRVKNHFERIACLNKELEEQIEISKLKNKARWLELIRDMRPHIIELKNLAE